MNILFYNLYYNLIQKNELKARHHTNFLSYLDYLSEYLNIDYEN